MRVRSGLILSLALTLSVCVSAQDAKPSPITLADNPASAYGPPIHPATEDQVREYLSLAGIVKASHNVMAANVHAMRISAVPYLPASFWDDMQSEMLKIDLLKICVPIYQRYLSEEDMAVVLTFYRSPGGQKLLGMQSFLVRDAQVVLEKQGREIGEAAYAKHKDEIDAAKKKYDAEHGTSQ